MEKGAAARRRRAFDPPLRPARRADGGWHGRDRRDRESLRLTGDPYEIGTELDRVHRPKTPKLLFALAALIALAGLAFTALVSFRDYELSYFAVHQCVALLLGTAAMLAAYFLDFTLLGRFALPLALMFHAALIPLGLLPIGGFWLRYIYVSTHILLRGLPLLFPLMFAVLLYALRGRHGWDVFAAFVCLAVQWHVLPARPVPARSGLSVSL